MSKKVILEIQPSWFELGDYFTDAANQAMIDSGYTHLATLEGASVGDQALAMETISAWLKDGDGYGILEYGGHGSSAGETGGETFATQAQANSKVQWLITWDYFNADELSIQQNPLQTYWIIFMKREYTSKDAEWGGPAGCDIAFISTCNGDVAGDFNTNCKVYGVGSTTNIVMISSFSCMMSWLVSSQYRKIDLAAAQCTATMSNPTFGFGYVCTGWQLFSFDNPAAEVFGFAVVDGVASWYLESDYHTERFYIEGSHTQDGPWDEIAVQKPPLIGANRVDVSSNDYRFFRLVEEETTGRRLIQGYAGAGRSSKSVYTSRAADIESRPRTEELRSRIAALKDRFKGKRYGWAPRTSGTASRVVIYARSSLLQATQLSIADFWVAAGCDVAVSLVDGFPQEADGFRSALKADIAGEVSAGADFILFVGDANDYREFSQPWPGDWESIRQNRIANGYPPGGQPEKDIVTTFTIPDELPRHIGMSYYSPYWFTDQPYGDVDDDGVADVVVARLPFTAEAEIYAYGTKLWSDPTWNADNIGFLVGDRMGGGWSQ